MDKSELWINQNYNNLLVIIYYKSVGYYFELFTIIGYYGFGYYYFAFLYA